MSKTPRTDEHLRMKEESGHTVKVSSEFARQLERELAEVRADVKDRDNALAAIMAVLPDDAKPCDAPDLIKHFKSQMLAYGSEYIRVEKQLKEARAEIERLKSEHEDSLRRAKDNAVSLSGAVTEYAGELLARDKLIEQMRADLQRAKENFETMDKILTTQCAPMSVAKAAYNTGMSYLNDALVAERVNNE